MNYYLHKFKNGIYNLRKNENEIPQSYCVIKINVEEVKDFLNLFNWERLDGYCRLDYNVLNEEDKKLFTRIYNSLFKEKEAYSNPDYTKTFNSNVEGTSKLVRDSNRTSIKIARRTGVKSLNKCTINCICIDDITREEFFKDVKWVHGYSQTNIYKLDIGDENFNKWNDFMNKEYLNQLNANKY